MRVETPCPGECVFASVMNSAIGMAKMRLNSVIERLAEDFRM